MSPDQEQSTTTTVDEQPAPIEDTDPGWRAMLDEWARDRWRRFHRGRDTDEWPPLWLLPALLAAGTILAVVVLAGLLLPLIRALVGFAASAITSGAGWLHDWNLTRIVLDPVHRYLDAHATGLPITADTLWWTWCATGTTFFLLAVFFRPVAARLGWVLYGAASVAMVWAVTTGPARPTTAGIAALWWTVLSLPALRRPGRPAKVTAHLPELPILASILQRRQ